MTDRELLEFAAKAAGLRINFHPTASYQWNPLERDDDALRLAVKLDMHIMSISGGEHEFVNVVAYGPGPEDFRDIYENHNGDPCQAMRRAIVLAAADIGKEMP